MALLYKSIFCRPARVNPREAMVSSSFDMEDYIYDIESNESRVGDIKYISWEQ